MVYVHFLHSSIRLPQIRVYLRFNIKSCEKTAFSFLENSELKTKRTLNAETPANSSSIFPLLRHRKKAVIYLVKLLNIWTESMSVFPHFFLYQYHHYDHQEQHVKVGGFNLVCPWIVLLIKKRTKERERERGGGETRKETSEWMDNLNIDFVKV